MNDRQGTLITTDRNSIRKEMDASTWGTVSHGNTQISQKKLSKAIFRQFPLPPVNFSNLQWDYVHRNKIMQNLS